MTAPVIVNRFERVYQPNIKNCSAVFDLAHNFAKALCDYVATGLAISSTTVFCSQ